METLKYELCKDIFALEFNVQVVDAVNAVWKVDLLIQVYL